MYDLLLYDFDLFYNLMKKPLPECARAYKKFVRKFFRYYQKKKKPPSKIQILKLLKGQKILRVRLVY